MTTQAPVIALDSVRLVEEFYARFRDHFEPEGYLEGVLARALRPTDPITVSQWADRYRILQSVDTDEAGPWRTTRTPYLKGIMDALTILSPERYVVFQKGAQIGATQAGNNFVGYAIHHAPGPILIAQPTAELAKRNSRQRIEPMIASCPELAARIYGEGAIDRAQTVLQKSFEGGILVMTGANSAVGLRSMSARYLFLDEVDGWPVDVDGEGDPVALAIARTRNFQRAKIFITSTPTVEGTSRVANWFKRGDMRFYFIPCPLCGEFQKLEFGGPDASFGLKWKSDRTGDVSYLCATCGRTFEEHTKTHFLAEGQWQPTNEHARPEIASFHLSSLYSPFGWYSWNQARDDFLATKDFPLALKGFVNTVLGETWKDDVSRVDDEDVAKRRERYPELNEKVVVPAPVVVMTAGIDTQDDRLEYTTLGWGLGEECWVLEHDIVAGDPAKREVWEELWRRMRLARPLERGDGSQVDYVRAWCLDTAGHHSNAAYEFARPRYRWKTPDGRNAYLFGTIGRSGPGHLWPKQPSRNNKLKILIWPLKVDAGKEALYTRLSKVRVAGPGYIHFPSWLDTPYFLQLTAEEIVHDFDLHGFPTRTWQLRTPGRRNEALDCWVLGYAALCGLIQHGLDLPREARDLARKLAKLRESPPEEGGLTPPGKSDILTSDSFSSGDGGTKVTTASHPEREVESLTDSSGRAHAPAKSWQRRRRRSFFLGR